MSHDGSPQPSSTDQADNSGPTRPELVVRNAMVLALASVWTRGLLFLWQLFLARWLGAHAYGVYGTIGAMLVVAATIPEFGVGLLVIRDVAHRPREAGRYLAATLTLQPPLALLGYLGLLVAATGLGYDLTLRRLLAFAAVSLVIDVLGNMCHNQLLAAERMGVTAAIATGHVTLLTVLGAASLAAGGGLWSLYAASMMAGVARTVAYWVALRRIGRRPVFPADAALVRALLTRGWPLAVTSLLSLAYLHANKLITTAVLGAVAAGQLMAAFIVVYGIIELASTTVLVAVLPAMARTHAAGPVAAFQCLVERLVGFTLALGLPVAICTSLLASELSQSVFGTGFTPTADALRILVWYAAAAMVANIFSAALTIQDRQSRLPAIRATQLALSAAVALVLLPRLGIVGAALALLLAEVIGLVLLLHAFRLPVTLGGSILKRGVRAVPAALALAYVVIRLGAIHPVAALVVGVPIYVTLLLVGGGTTKEDRTLLRHLLTAWSGGGPTARGTTESPY